MGADMIALGFVADDDKWYELKAKDVKDVRTLAAQFWAEGLTYDKALQDADNEMVIEDMFAAAREAVGMEVDRDDADYWGTDVPIWIADKERLLDAVAADIKSIHDVVDGRDVTYWKGDTSFLFLTGGMTWGDDPTDAFTELSRILEAANLFCPGLLEELGIRTALHSLLP